MDAHSQHIYDEVKRTYRNAKTCGKEGHGTHRACGQNGLVGNLWMEAVANARKAGVDYKKAMQEVRDEP